MSVIIPGSNLAQKVSLTQNMSLWEVGAPVTSGSWTASTTNTAFGSTLFLNRIFFPGAMTLTEVDMLHQLSFASSSLSGAGTMSQYFAVFSFDGGTNSTKLDSMFSASSSWAWVSGSASANLTGVQNGWTGTLVHSMGLSSGSAGTSIITGGEYIIGNLINVSIAPVAAGSAGGSDVSMSMYGNLLMTNVTSTTLGAMSSAALSAGSFIGTLNTASALSNAGTALVTFISSVAQLAITNIEGTKTFASESGGTITTATAGALSGVARTILSASTSASGTHFTVAPTSVSVISNAGLVAVSAFTAANASISAVTNLGTVGPLAFSFQNTGSSYSTAIPSYFSCGMMATAAIPTNITITSTNVTFTGSRAMLQPWFAVLGS